MRRHLVPCRTRGCSCFRLFMFTLLGAGSIGLLLGDLVAALQRSN